MEKKNFLPPLPCQHDMSTEQNELNSMRVFIYSIPVFSQNNLWDSQLFGPRGTQQTGPRHRVWCVVSWMCHVSFFFCHLQSCEQCHMIFTVWNWRITNLVAWFDQRLLSFFFQVHTDVWQPPFRDPRPEGDLQMYKGSSVQPALLTFPCCTETHLRHSAEKPQRQTRTGSNPQPRILHQSTSHWSVSVQLLNINICLGKRSHFADYCAHVDQAVCLLPPSCIFLTFCVWLFLL